MIFWIAEALLFLLPVTARTWRALAWRALAAAALVAVGLFATGAIGLNRSGGGANIGAGLVPYYGATRLGGGLLARAASLTAEAAGHRQPWSLWIEALFYFAAPLLLDRALGV